MLPENAMKSMADGYQFPDFDRVRGYVGRSAKTAALLREFIEAFDDFQAWQSKQPDALAVQLHERTWALEQTAIAAVDDLAANPHHSEDARLGVALRECMGLYEELRSAPTRSR
jgi:hypothetical protein